MALLERRIFIENWFDSDEQFDQLYPPPIQLLAKRHWTPLKVARKAAEFLATENDVRILDIGSGVGKFCLAAAYYKPGAFYYGVEQRRSLIHHAESAKEELTLKNISFIQKNFTQLDFKNYNHFYFYNSFYENLIVDNRIDNSIAYSTALYNYYNRYLRRQLDQMPSGTRLVTFHSLEDEVPQSYKVAGSAMDNVLKFWIKI